MLAELEAWITQHDHTLELTAIWSLAIGFGVYALIKLVSWWVVRSQDSVTPVGDALKVQKLHEAIMGACMSLLYGMTLYAYYFQHRYGIWEQTIVRTLVALGIIGAVVWGVRFVVALWRERRRQP